MCCPETVTVNLKAVNWLKEKYPELCIKAGLCERIGGRLYTKTLYTTPQPKQEHDGSLINEGTKSKQEQGEPVAFLANGTRFKISYDSRQSGGQIHGIPPELGGCWVAFVAADDDCHLKLTTLQQRTWVGLNWSDLPDELVGKPTFMEGAKWAESKLREKNT